MNYIYISQRRSFQFCVPLHLFYTAGFLYNLRLSQSLNFPGDVKEFHNPYLSRNYEVCKMIARDIITGKICG
jgi:hypothetical protein